MRKLSLLAVLLCVISLMSLSVACRAQSGPGGQHGFGGPGGQHGFGGPGGGGRGFDRLSTALSLTPAQAAKIKPIYDSFRAKTFALRNDPKLNDQQRVAKTLEIFGKRDQAIKPFLKPGQFVKLKFYEAQQSKWAARGAAGGFGGRPGGPGGFKGGPGGQPHM